MSEMSTHKGEVTPLSEACQPRSAVVEIEGEVPFKHGSFVAQRPPLKSRSENTTVNYKSRASTGDGEANFNANFDGPLAAFRTLDRSPEGFSSRAGSERRIELEFNWQVDDPEPVTDTEDDILAELADELNRTGITVRARAIGPSSIKEEGA